MTHRDSVLTITLNRPAQRNALNGTMLNELNDVLAAAAEDEQVRAIVLTGAGKGFCAGADLADFTPDLAPDDVYRALIERYWPLIKKLTMLPKPVIGAVNGAAAGAGASLALACDLRVMADDAYIMQAFSNIGLVPDAGSTYFLGRQIGYSRAYQIAVEAEKVGANQCLQWGLTNRVAAAADLLDEAQSWAARLAQRPTVALGLTKAAFHQAINLTLEEAIANEARLQTEAIVTEDHREGIMAFMQRRAPEFKGR